MKTPSSVGLPSILVLASILGTGLAIAGLPEQRHHHINDFAGLLSNAEAIRLTDKLEALENRRGVRLTVVTIDRFRSYQTNDSTFERFATRLFNDWGIGNAQRNDGILLLVGKSDRKLRIELGRGYSSAWDRRAKTIIDGKIVPEFEKGAYVSGIEKGIDGLIAALDQPAAPPKAATPKAKPISPENQLVEAPDPPRKKPSPPSHAPERFSSPPKSSPPLASIIGVGIGGLGTLLLTIFGLTKLGRRKCQRCATEMVVIKDRARLQPLLSETNQVEQRVGSVKFKLWFCPRCEHEEVQRSHRWFSGFSDCPECHARTLHRSSDIITQPTRWSTGEELVIHHCANCSYHRESTQILARLPDDDDDNNNSGGFSSFGSSGGGGNSGGSSSGGGASGSW